jgi:hypothetical protein
MNGPLPIKQNGVVFGASGPRLFDPSGRQIGVSVEKDKVAFIIAGGDGIPIARCEMPRAQAGTLALQLLDDLDESPMKGKPIIRVKQVG